MRASRWAVVIPVKRLYQGKSRLRGAIAGVSHERLALALSHDTIVAVLACSEVAEVLVVTDDDVVRDAACAVGAVVVPDRPAAGLNAAIEYGVTRLTRADGWVAALTADLPALRPVELAEALLATGNSRAATRWFVRDTSGSGTVLLAAAPGVPLSPRFGPGSAAAHATTGALPLAGDWPSLRRDVDTEGDLRAAELLGLGRHTSAAMRGQVLEVGDLGARCG